MCNYLSFALTWFRSFAFLKYSCRIRIGILFFLRAVISYPVEVRNNQTSTGCLRRIRRWSTTAVWCIRKAYQQSRYGSGSSDLYIKLWIKFRILLLSSVAFKMPIKNKFVFLSIFFYYHYLLKVHSVLGIRIRIRMNPHSFGCPQFGSGCGSVPKSSVTFRIQKKYIFSYFLMF